MNKKNIIIIISVLFVCLITACQTKNNTDNDQKSLEETLNGNCSTMLSGTIDNVERIDYKKENAYLINLQVGKVISGKKSILDKKIKILYGPVDKTKSKNIEEKLLSSFTSGSYILCILDEYKEDDYIADYMFPNTTDYVFVWNNEKLTCNTDLYKSFNDSSNIDEVISYISGKKIPYKKENISSITMWRYSDSFVEIKKAETISKFISILDCSDYSLSTYDDEKDATAITAEITYSDGKKANISLYNRLHTDTGVYSFPGIQKSYNMLCDLYDSLETQ